jgi:FkbM family methyltransferase
MALKYLKKMYHTLRWLIFKRFKVFDFPYKKSYFYRDVQWDFWITDVTAQKWYDNINNNNTSELSALFETLDKEEVFLEVGTHYGFYSSFLNKTKKISIYHGIDIQPSCVLYSQGNLQLNQIQNAQVHNFAVSDLSNRVLNYNPSKTGNAVINKIIKTGYNIISITLDDFIEKNQIKPTFIKIDVEGHELNVLKGAKKLLQQKPKIALEIHGNHLSKSQKMEIFDLIQIDNYQGEMFLGLERKLVPFDKVAVLNSNDIVNIFLKKNVALLK